MIFQVAGSASVLSPSGMPPAGPTCTASGTTCRPTGWSAEWTAAATRRSGRPPGRSLLTTPTPRPLEVRDEVRAGGQADADDVGREVVDTEVRHQRPQGQCGDSQSAERDQAEADKAPS